MAITLDSGFPVTSRDTAGWVNSHTWPAFTTPGSDRIVVAIRLHNGSLVVTANTFTSPNLTWTKRAAAIDSATNFVAEIWTAQAASVVTSEVITETYSGGHAYSRGSFVVLSLAGASGIGANAVSSTSASGGDPSLALTATAANSYLIGGLAYRSSGSDTSVDGNTTSVYSGGGGGGFGFNERAGSRVSSAASSHTLGFAGDDVFGAWQMAALEILEAGGGGGPTGNPWYAYLQQ